jgi:hypothetical protein
MDLGIILNHIQKQELQEKVQLKYGNQLKLTKTKNGLKSTMTQTLRKKHLVQK